MKALIFILFIFYSAIANSQLLILERNNGWQTAGVGSTVSFPFEAGKLYIAFMFVTNSAGSPAVASITGTGQTWTSIADITFNTIATGNSRLQAFRHYSTTTHTDNITYGYTGTQDGSGVIILEVSNAVNTGTNGADAIVQIVTNRADATSNPNVTMAALTGSHNGVAAAFMNQTNPFTGTAEAGWFETEDNGYNTPTTGGYCMYRNTTTDNTPTVTAASSNWGGIAIEIASNYTVSDSGLPLYFYGFNNNKIKENEKDKYVICRSSFSREFIRSKIRHGISS
jgi:hypothetical protein